MKLFKRIIIASLGMSMMSIGIGFIVNSCFGDDIVTLSMEAFRKIWPLSIGTYNFIYGSILLLIAFVLDKKKIGFATLYYITVGVFLIDKSIEIIPIADNLFIQFLYTAIAIILISLSVGFAVSARLGLGYYDAFLYAVSEKFKISYVIYKYILEGVLLVFSLFLKTYPGIGTLIYIIILGPAIDLAVKTLKKPIRQFIGIDVDD